MIRIGKACIVILLLIFSSCATFHGKEQVIVFEPDTISNLKNPYMGWTLYSENKSRHTNGKDYWEAQDEAAQKYAGVFYLRWKWEDVEPEEGKYAWDNDSVFQNLIQGALDRNLRIAFRVYTHTGTPQYVLDGAKTYEHWGKQTPYADDEFFLEKYTKFIAAFGAKYNDPAIVDYVDAYGMGWWGEGHNIKYDNKKNKHASHDRIVKAYAKAFDKVINVVNFGVRDSIQDRVVYEELGMTPRRDGYASKWFPKKQQDELVSHFPNTPIIAEACYWGKNDISYHIAHEDGNKYWDTWQEYYSDVVDLALATHANYLDMRTVDETKRYVEEAPMEAQQFLARGGYRIYPNQIKYAVKNGTLQVEHTWENLGVGLLPNNNKNLGNKYKVAFALFDENNKLIKQWISTQVEVSELIGHQGKVFKEEFSLTQIQNAQCKLAVAIINTNKNDSKDITLAIKDANKLMGEWVFVGPVVCRIFN